MAKHQINFPAIEMVTKVEGGQTYVWDPLRSVYLLLTPEEEVRRYVIAFLISHCGVLPHSIAQEYSVKINGTAQRAEAHQRRAERRYQRRKSRGIYRTDRPGQPWLYLSR